MNRLEVSEAAKGEQVTSFSLRGRNEAVSRFYMQCWGFFQTRPVLERRYHVMTTQISTET